MEFSQFLSPIHSVCFPLRLEWAMFLMQKVFDVESSVITLKMNQLKNETDRTVLIQMVKKWQRLCVLTVVM